MKKVMKEKYIRNNFTKNIYRGRRRKRFVSRQIVRLTVLLFLCLCAIMVLGFSWKESLKKEAARQKIEKKRERRIFDTSTSSGIKKQAKEDIRILKVERKLAKKAQAQALKDAKREKAAREQQRKEDKKDAVRTAKYEKKEALRREKYEKQEAARLEKEAKKEAAYRKKHPVIRKKLPGAGGDLCKRAGGRDGTGGDTRVNLAQGVRGNLRKSPGKTDGFG